MEILGQLHYCFFFFFFKFQHIISVLNDNFLSSDYNTNQFCFLIYLLKTLSIELIKSLANYMILFTFHIFYSENFLYKKKISNTGTLLSLSQFLAKQDNANFVH